MKLLWVISLSLVSLAALVPAINGDSYISDYLASYMSPPQEPSTTSSFSSSYSTSYSSSHSSSYSSSKSSSLSSYATPSPAAEPMPSLQSSLQFNAKTRAKVSSALQIARSSGCHPSVCFALDASSQLSAAEFRMQLDFIKLVSAIISLDERAAFAAVRYARRARRVVRLTSDATRFLRRVDLQRQRCPCSDLADVGKGVRTCARQLRRAEGDVRKMVVFGDGRAAVTGRAAGRFLEKTGAGICAVEVGGNGNMMKKELGENSNVLAVGSWYDVLDVVDELVSAVCDAPPPS